jgi:two-component system response regulator FixJ
MPIGTTASAMPQIPGTVIVVDDDAAVRRSLKFALELEGLDVRLYGGGDELLAAQDLPAAGCLVVDYYMPSMNGVELVDRLRRRDVALPAILITSKATEDLRNRAARAGFARVLEKPLEDSSLVDSIRGALAPMP